MKTAALVELLRIVVRSGWSFAFVFIFIYFIIKLDVREISFLKERCTKAVDFSVTDWHKRDKRYIAIYSYRLNGMDFSIEGKKRRREKRVEFNRVMVNPDKPTEIYEPDFVTNPNNIQKSRMIGIVTALLMIPLSLIYLKIR